MRARLDPVDAERLRERGQPVIVSIAEHGRIVLALCGIAAVVLLGAALAAAADIQGWFL